MFASSNGSSLFTADAMKAMCEMENELVWTFYNRTCPLHSLGFYVAVLSGKTCLDLNDADVRHAEDLLLECSKFYHQGSLQSDCTAKPCNVPRQCAQHNAVHKILYYMTDVDFLSAKKPQNLFLESAISFFRYHHDDAKTFYFEKLDSGNLDNGVVKVIGVYLDQVKRDVFDKYLIEDMMYFAVAMALIVVIMCFYLRSVAIMIATVLNVGFSFSVAYFLYFVVLRFEFFPFLNLMTVLVLIGIGADDVFIFYDTWQQIKQENVDGDLQTRIVQTFRHAAVSIFVTSFTTAAAFLANFVSTITAIRCFGVFSAIAILSNFVLMITWIPAIIILIERFNDKYCKTTCTFLDQCQEVASRASKAFFGKILPAIVIKPKFIWLFLFLSLGAGGFVVVFVTPQLKLPSSSNFQVLPLTHPVEAYDFSLQDRFQFLKDRVKTSQYQIWLVWGLKAEDTGNWLNPNDTAGLRFDDDFSLRDGTSKQWMSAMCHKLKNQTFVNKQYKQRPCAFDLYKKILKESCLLMHSVPALSPCCNYSRNTDNQELFDECLPLLTVLALRMTGAENRSLDAPVFDSNNKLKAYVVSFTSTQAWTTSYKPMDTFYKNINSFMTSLKETAPPGLKGGWFSGWFFFYDLQVALSSGTYIAIGVSLTVAFGMMLITTLNVLITIYAILTIALSISVTVGALVLMGWELNLLESVTISLAVGLSIDFTIHYGVAYKLATSGKREVCVRVAFGRVGSAVTMAAVTTFLAGAAVLPCRVLAYTQLGVFLMIVMTTCYLYATFFFQSLCSFIGPKGTLCEIPSLSKCRHKKSPEVTQNGHVPHSQGTGTGTGPAAAAPEEVECLMVSTV